MTSPAPLRLLSAGACQSLFQQLAAPLADFHLQASFAPVGQLTRQLRAGEQADVLVTSRTALTPLLAEDRILTDTVQTVGRVPTSVGVPEGASGASLAGARDAPSFVRELGAFSHIYLPDTQHATAGRQVLALLQAQGVADALAARLHAAPNGAAAVARMIADGYDSAVAFAQRTEIVATAGAVPACNLPEGYELVTEYCVALLRRPVVHPQARVFMAQFHAQLTPALLGSLGFAQADDARSK